MTQLNIFDEDIYTPTNALTDDVSGLTDRQIALKQFFEDFYQKYKYQPSDYEVLVNMDDEWYGYFAETDRKQNADFNNLTSRRELTKDKEALSFHQGTTKVFVGNGYATTDWQIQKQIIKYYIEGKKAFKKMQIAIEKAKSNNQLAFDYDDFTEDNPIREYESKLKVLSPEALERMSVDEMEYFIKQYDKKHKKFRKLKTHNPEKYLSHENELPF